MYAMTAAHPTLPIPSYARIRNPANGRVVIVRINDRGPFHAGRIVDLSYIAALKLDLLRGVAPVELERITPTRSAPAPGAARATARLGSRRAAPCRGAERAALWRRLHRWRRPTSHGERAARSRPTSSRRCRHRHRLPMSTPSERHRDSSATVADAVAPVRPVERRRARLLDPARRLPRARRRAELPAPRRRRQRCRLARAAARDLRRCHAVPRPGRAVREPRRGRGRGDARAQLARHRADDRRASMSARRRGVARPRSRGRSSSSPATWSMRRGARCRAFRPSWFRPRRERIAAALDAIDAGPADLAITQGAAGGDVLFAEACLERAVPLRLHAAADRVRIRQAVAAAGGGRRRPGARAIAPSSRASTRRRARRRRCSARSPTATTPSCAPTRWLLETALAVRCRAPALHLPVGRRRRRRSRRHAPSRRRRARASAATCSGSTRASSPSVRAEH